MKHLKSQESRASLRAAWQQISPWLGLGAIATLLVATGLGWVLGGVVLVVLVVPVVLGVLGVAIAWGLIWWAKRRLVAEACPACGQAQAAFEGMTFKCLACGTPLTAQGGHLLRTTPPGTIDVQAINMDQGDQGEK